MKSPKPRHKPPVWADSLGVGHGASHTSENPISPNETMHIMYMEDLRGVLNRLCSQGSIGISALTELPETRVLTTWENLMT